MNRIDNLTKPLAWLMAFLLAAFVAGCGGGGGGVGGTATDTTAPTVISTAPSNLDTGIALNANITATFSEPMNPATITTTTFVLLQGTTPVSGVVTYAGTIATFNPNANLTPSTVYTVKMVTGARDLAGNALPTKTWSFTTGAAVDNTPPTVSSTSPMNSDTGVVKNANITATFSEAMDPSTISVSTFTLAVSGVSATPVAGAVTYAGLNATFNPTSDLAASTTYTATIITGVTDLAGNALASNFVWSFTTGTTVAANPAPVLLGTAANYAILAETGVATVPGSIVTGNVGLSPAAGSYLTGWSESLDTTATYATSAQVVAPSKLYAADYVGGTTSADLGTSVLNMGTAYTDAAGRTATSAATTDIGSGTLTSLTLSRGVYEWGSAVIIPTDLTLNGSATDVWIFKVAGTLDMAAAKNVILTGGALPKNVFWQVSGAVNIGANTHFAGIILGQTAITFGNLSSIDGRLLAQTAVNLDATTVTQP